MFEDIHASKAGYSFRVWVGSSSSAYIRAADIRQKWRPGRFEIQELGDQISISPCERYKTYQDAIMSASAMKSCILAFSLTKRLHISLNERFEILQKGRGSKFSFDRSMLLPDGSTTDNSYFASLFDDIIFNDCDSVKSDGSLRSTGMRTVVDPTEFSTYIHDNIYKFKTEEPSDRWYRLNLVLRYPLQRVRIACLHTMLDEINTTPNQRRSYGDRLFEDMRKYIDDLGYVPKEDRSSILSTTGHIKNTSPKARIARFIQGVASDAVKGRIMEKFSDLEVFADDLCAVRNVVVHPERPLRIGINLNNVDFCASDVLIEYAVKDLSKQAA